MDRSSSPQSRCSEPSSIEIVESCRRRCRWPSWAHGLVILCWAAYQYLLIVYSGSTPGLRALQLQVQRFDGNPANRKLRRGALLCALLSAISLGMGYAWHFLDEDGLCWHERVTRTHIAVKPETQ